VHPSKLHFCHQLRRPTSTTARSPAHHHLLAVPGERLRTTRRSRGGAARGGGTPCATSRAWWSSAGWQRTFLQKRHGQSRRDSRRKSRDNPGAEARRHGGAEARRREARALARRVRARSGHGRVAANRARAAPKILRQPHPPHSLRRSAHIAHVPAHAASRTHARAAARPLVHYRLV
jgi:hypothetical protein